MLLRTLFTFIATLGKQRVSLFLFFLLPALFLSTQLTPLEGTGRAQNPPARTGAPRDIKTTPASGDCCGQKTWAQKSTTGPSANATALAYDQARKRTVLFGGHGFNNQTWEWNGSTWTLASPTGAIPSGRWAHKLAYDTQQQVTVLFGGADSTGYKGDTWEWNGMTWTLRAVSGSSPRRQYAMAYDSQRHVTVLFGGRNGSSDLGDTWEWDSLAGTWSLKSNTGPSPRRGLHEGVLPFSYNYQVCR
jgi:hypothetical protein